MRANMQRGGGFGQRGMRRRQPGSADVITRPQFTQNTRRPDAQRANRGGLNENYAREIMELHTLGVNGGYTQTDVTELARVFTGWTILGDTPPLPEYVARIRSALKSRDCTQP